jgi:hypothetical protein
MKITSFQRFISAKLNCRVVSSGPFHSHLTDTAACTAWQTWLLRDAVEMQDRAAGNY